MAKASKKSTKTVTPTKKVKKNPTDGLSWHKKIAASRAKNTKWKKNLSKGRLEAAFKPSLIRIARLEQGLGQDIISKKIGVSESTFGEIERGKRLVKEDKAQKIASALKKSWTNLFKASQSKNKFVAVIK